MSISSPGSIHRAPLRTPPREVSRALFRWGEPLESLMYRIHVLLRGSLASMHRSPRMPTQYAWDAWESLARSSPLYVPMCVRGGIACSPPQKAPRPAPATPEAHTRTCLATCSSISPRLIFLNSLVAILWGTLRAPLRVAILLVVLVLGFFWFCSALVDLLRARREG